MNARTQFNKLNVLLFVGISALFSFSAHAQVEEAKIGRMSAEFEHAKTEAEVSARTGAVLDKIALQMSVSRQAVFDYFKAEAPKMSEASNEAWSSLLNATSVKTGATATADDYVHADLASELVGSYIDGHKASLVQDLPLNEVDLAKIVKNWDVKQKENFARVLKRTSEIAKSTSIPTMSQAFDQALKELGYYDEYQKGCKR